MNKLTHLNQFLSERLKEEIKNSKLSNMIMLGHTGLDYLPHQIIPEWSDKIRRIDLSYNNIYSLNISFSAFTNLRELWLQQNPITELPQGIHTLSKLELLDIRGTTIAEIPTEIANLDLLYEMDWRDTPLAVRLKDHHDVEVNDVLALRQLLQEQNTRKLCERSLFEYMLGEHFIMDADLPGMKEVVEGLVVDISLIFDDLTDLGQFVRRVGKFLPSRVHELQPDSVSKAKEGFLQMKRDTNRKRLSGEVEIKLRAIYFDRIERTEVMGVIDSIFASVASLEDMEFLVQYATQVMPPTPQEATGPLIWQNILDLQSQLTEKRESAIMALASAMGQLYPEQKPIDVQNKAREIASFLQSERFADKKELTKMSQLNAECNKVFPPDFLAIDPEAIMNTAQTVIFKKTMVAA